MKSFSQFLQDALLMIISYILWPIIFIMVISLAPEITVITEFEWERIKKKKGIRRCLIEGHPIIVAARVRDYLSSRRR